MTNQEAIDDIRNNILPVVGGKSLLMAIEALKAQDVTDTNVGNKYEYHYDHTDCIWYRPEARNRCPSTCAQYRDGWNDAMNYIFRDGKGYRPYRRDRKYEDGSD